MAPKHHNSPAYSYLTCLKIIGVAIALKVLLFPFYHSTDFEVHRNWLAITYSLPLHQWYHEKTSEWTLDYPPFFAYFEYILAQFAQFFDADMLEIHNLNHDNMMTVCFQRSSVLVTESVLYIATIRYLESSKMIAPGRCDHDSLVIFLLVVFNAGLIIVDNIHFQYNGMMLGLIILCGDFANRNMHRSLAVTFSVLVLLKHLFAPLAPVVAAYLLKAYCVQCAQCHDSKCIDHISSALPRNQSRSWLRLGNFFQLCVIAITALLVAFLPFLVIVAPASEPAQSVWHSIRSLEVLTFGQGGGGQLQLLLPFVPAKCILDWEYSVEQLRQIASRLFPFGRGLVHAYWAPNVWALYIMLDKGLKFLAGQVAVHSMKTQSLVLSTAALCLCPSYDSSTGEGGLNAATSGLVGEFQFSCVPAVPAALSMLLVVLLQLPAVVKICFQPHCHRAQLQQRQGAGAVARSNVPILPYGLFLKTVSYGAMTLFMFGYHVHEKAILVTLLPLTLLLSPSSIAEPGLGFGTNRERELWHAVFLQVAAGGVTALLPLLMRVEELALKGVLCFSFLVATNVLVAPASGPFFASLNRITIALLLVLFLFNELVHPFLFWSPALDALRFPFLPLLLYSTFCALVLLHAYVLMFFALFDIGEMFPGPIDSTSDEDLQSPSSFGTLKIVAASIFALFTGRAGRKQSNVRKPPSYRSFPPNKRHPADARSLQHTVPGSDATSDSSCLLSGESGARGGRSGSVSSAHSQGSRGG